YEIQSGLEFRRVLFRSCHGRGQERASLRLARDAKRGAWGAGGSPRRASPPLARDAKRGVWGAGGSPRRASPRLARDAKRGVWGEIGRASGKGGGEERGG